MNANRMVAHYERLKEIQTEDIAKIEMAMAPLEEQLSDLRRRRRNVLQRFYRIGARLRALQGAL